MRNLSFSVAVLALFALGFIGVLKYQAVSQGKPIAALFVPRVECDAMDDLCRKRLRAQAELFFSAGDFTGGESVYHRLATAGDVQSAFQLGWHHDEAYHRAVGEELVAQPPLAEISSGVGEHLPQGGDFEELIARHMVPSEGAARLVHLRALAYLWYLRAVEGGFAPAANNIGAMHQYGLLGGVDTRSAKDWYKRAAGMGSPVGAANYDLVTDHEAGQNTSCGRGFELPLFSYTKVDRPEVTLDDLLGHTRVRGKAPSPAVMKFFRTSSAVIAEFRSQAGSMPEGVYSDPPVASIINEIAGPEKRTGAGTKPVKPGFVDCEFKPGPGVTRN